MELCGVVGGVGALTEVLACRRVSLARDFVGVLAGEEPNCEGGREGSLLGWRDPPLSEPDWTHSWGFATPHVVNMPCRAVLTAAG